MKMRFLAAFVLGAFAAGAAHGSCLDAGDVTAECIALDMEKTIDVDGCTGPGVSDLPHIRFEVDSHALKPEAAPQIAAIARALRRYPGDAVIIEGHADASHTRAHNQALSEKRATTVGDAVAAYGGLGLISTRGHGEDRLLYPDDPHHAHNRRVAIVRVSANSVIKDAVAAADDGRHALSAHVRKADPSSDSSYIIDPEAEALKTGDHFFACISASRTGILKAENKAPGSDRFIEVGAWRMPAETIARAPAAGTFRMRGEAGVEVLRLRHIACDAPSRPCDQQVAANAQFERIRLGRARPAPIRIVPSPDVTSADDCGMAGVTCLTLRLRHQP